MRTILVDERELNRLELAAVQRMTAAQASGSVTLGREAVAYRDGVNSVTARLRALPSAPEAAPSPGFDFLAALTVAALIIGAGALLMPPAVDSP